MIASIEWVISLPLAIIFTVLGLAALAVLFFCLLPCFGFTSAGVAVGSFAASWMSSIGIVAGGSLFSLLQSLGALGVGALLSKAAFAFFAFFTTLILGIYYYFTKYFSGDDSATPPPVDGGNPAIPPVDGGNSTIPPADGGNSTILLVDGGNSTIPLVDGGNSTIPLVDGGNSTIPLVDGGNSTIPPVDGGNDILKEAAAINIFRINLYLSVVINGLAGFILGLLVASLWIYLRDRLKRARGKSFGPIYLPINRRQEEDGKRNKRSNCMVFVFVPLAGLLMGSIVGVVAPYHFF